MRGMLAAALSLGVLALASCKTGPPPEPAPEPVAVTPFVPAQPFSHIAAGEARYPGLYAPESFAVWVGPEVAAAKREAAKAAGETIDPELERAAAFINDNYYVIECRLESTFADMSIAYDAVGLRGIDVYLMTPNGYRVPPMQKLIGTHLDEEPVDALKRFGRTNIFVFPKVDVLANAPALASNAPSVRLLLEGHNSTFYFQWQRADSGVAPEPPSRIDVAYDATKTGFNDFYSRLRRLVHVFD